MPGVLPAGGEQPIVAVRPLVMPSIYYDEKKRMKRFQRLSTYLYVSSYFSPYLDIPHGSLDIPVSVSTLVGDSVVVDRVYRYFVVTIGGYETIVDLLLLNLVYFDVFLCVDWLSLYYAIFYCHTETVTLAIVEMSRLEWTGSLGLTPSRGIPFLKAQPIFDKECLAYLTFVRHTSVNTSNIESIPLVREFLDKFPEDLPSMPPDRDTDFDIDLVPNT
ncbi:uncharacterized protein [Nicotiana tomentosiformis]|uniref:uncharacterized protein n=1 Tax=Nicotiana tomentosiformis TaxID=4098 RepID=UPI00388C4669